MYQVKQTEGKDNTSALSCYYCRVLSNPNNFVYPFCLEVDRHNISLFDMYK